MEKLGKIICRLGCVLANNFLSTHFPSSSGQKDPVATASLIDLDAENVNPNAGPAAIPAAAVMAKAPLRFDLLTDSLENEQAPCKTCKCGGGGKKEDEEEEEKKAVILEEDNNIPLPFDSPPKKSLPKRPQAAAKPPLPRLGGGLSRRSVLAAPSPSVVRQTPVRQLPARPSSTPQGRE